jgi:hypothetical protein
MPRFLNPNAEGLNDTIRPKQKVFKNMVRTFVDEKFPNLGDTASIDQMYDNLSTTATSLYTSLAELVNAIIYTNARATILVRNRRALTEYFSKIRLEANKMNLLLNKYRTFNFLLPDQIANLNSLVSSIVQKYGELKSAPSLAGANTIQTSLFENEIANISELDLILQKIQGLLGSYRQVPPSTSVQGAITAIPIPPATQYGRGYSGGAGYSGGSILPDYSRLDAPFYPNSDGYTINTIAYSQPARFY